MRHNQGWALQAAEMPEVQRKRDDAEMLIFDYATQI